MICYLLLKVAVRIVPIVLLVSTPALANGSGLRGPLKLSGIMVYSTDASGTPVPPRLLDVRPTNDLTAHVWRSCRDDFWFALGVYAGLPPASLRDSPTRLNGVDFSLDVPLKHGENVFTIAGEPGVGIEGEGFTHYAANLYFNDELDTPGVSMLFPRFGAAGTVPIKNPSPYVYGLSRSRSPTPKNPVEYRRGSRRVRITEVSFLQSQGSDEFDVVFKRLLRAGGRADYVGSVIIDVSSNRRTYPRIPDYPHRPLPRGRLF